MQDGKYKVIEEIHVYSCILGQLKIPKGKIIEIKEHGFSGYADGIRFDARLLEYCQHMMVKL